MFVGLFLCLNLTVTLFGCIVYFQYLLLQNADLPTFLMSKFNIPFYFGGTALLIVVGVSIDTISQIESHLISGNYEGFLGRGGAKRIKGRS